MCLRSAILALLLLFGWLPSQAQAPSAPGKLVYNATLPLEKGMSLRVADKYGSIVLEHWDQPQVAIAITLLPASPGQPLPDPESVQVVAESRRSELFLQASLTPDAATAAQPQGQLAYHIKLPRSTPVHISQEFGDLTLPSWGASLVYMGRYCTLKADDLLNASSFIEAESCTLKVNLLRAGEVNATYCTLELGTVAGGLIDARYSTTTIAYAQDMSASFSSGSLSLRRIGTWKGTCAYNTVRLGRLEGSLDLRANYVTGLELELMPGFERLQVVSNWSDVRLMPTPKASFNLSARLGQGRLLQQPPQLSLSINRELDGETQLEGTYGNGTGGSVVLSGQYVNLSFQPQVQ